MRFLAHTLLPFAFLCSLVGFSTPASGDDDVIDRTIGILKSVRLYADRMSRRRDKYPLRTSVNLVLDNYIYNATEDGFEFNDSQIRTLFDLWVDHKVGYNLEDFVNRIQTHLAQPKWMAGVAPDRQSLSRALSAAPLLGEAGIEPFLETGITFSGFPIPLGEFRIISYLIREHLFYSTQEERQRLDHVAPLLPVNPFLLPHQVKYQSAYDAQTYFADVYRHAPDAIAFDRIVSQAIRDNLATISPQELIWLFEQLLYKPRYLDLLRTFVEARPFDITFDESIKDWFDSRTGCAFKFLATDHQS
jgi:hypothetical protein